MLSHEESTPFICEHCGQRFQMRTNLNSHVFHKHNDVKKHSCTECDKTFKTRTQLLVHKRSHSGEKPFACCECDYRSTTRGNMRLHLSNKHRLDVDFVQEYMLNLKKTDAPPDSRPVKPRFVPEVTKTGCQSLQDLAKKAALKCEMNTKSKDMDAKKDNILGTKRKRVRKPYESKIKKLTELINTNVSAIKKKKESSDVNVSNFTVATGNMEEGEVMFLTDTAGNPTAHQIILQSIVPNMQLCSDPYSRQLNAVPLTPVTLTALPQTNIIQGDLLQPQQHFIIQANPGEFTTLLTADGNIIQQEAKVNPTLVKATRGNTIQTPISVEGQATNIVCTPQLQTNSNSQIVIRTKDLQTTSLQPTVKQTVEKKILQRLLVDNRHPSVQIHIPIEPAAIDNDQGPDLGKGQRVTIDQSTGKAIPVSLVRHVNTSDSNHLEIQDVSYVPSVSDSGDQTITTEANLTTVSQDTAMFLYQQGFTQQL